MRPMLASLDEPPMVQRGFVYEPKYDGIRALVDLAPPAKGGAPHVHIYSRNGNEKTAQFPAIATALGKIARTLDGPVLLDGEIVAIDERGRPLGFQFIQGRIHRTTPGEIERGEREQAAVLVLFDQLRDGDEDLRSLPLAARRLRLQDRVRLNAQTRPVLRLSEMVVDDGRPLLERAEKEGWEGLIVKDGQSVYQSGRRTPAWKKIKLLKQQEFVVGGWTEPRQSRQNFGALLLGYYDANGDLRWAGSVGTGFNEAELDPRLEAPARTRNSQKPVPGDAQNAGAATLGEAGAGRRGALYRVDQRRIAAATGVSRDADRQGREGCRS